MKIELYLTINGVTKKYRLLGLSANNKGIYFQNVHSQTDVVMVNKSDSETLGTALFTEFSF